MRSLTVSVLFENRSINSSFSCGHGLSLLIEYEGNSILFDSGLDDNFYQNALMMNKNIADVKTAVLSHGHIDHGGGFSSFFNHNSDAAVFFHSLALSSTYSGISPEQCQSIGIECLKFSPKRIQLINKTISIGEGQTILTNFSKSGFLPSGNKKLFWKNPDTGIIEHDPFRHEIALALDTGKDKVLFTGCAHSGISNIIKTCTERCFIPDYVIGGFHLSSRGRIAETLETIEQLQKELTAFPEIIYFTGHCTGTEAFTALKKRLKNRLYSLSTGQVIEFPVRIDSN